MSCRSLIAQVGMLYAVAQASLEETGGGEGVEVLANEPYTGKPLMDGKYSEVSHKEIPRLDQVPNVGFFSQGQYTKKIYHLENKVPSIVKYIAPKGSLQLHEEAWNSHPEYCRTVITNPGYMKDNFLLKIETLCVEGDRGNLDNAHGLPPELLAKRKVVKVDIASNQVKNDGFESKVK